MKRRILYLSIGLCVSIFLFSLISGCAETQKTRAQNENPKETVKNPPRFSALKDGLPEPLSEPSMEKPAMTPSPFGDIPVKRPEEFEKAGESELERKIASDLHAQQKDEISEPSPFPKTGPRVPAKPKAFKPAKKQETDPGGEVILNFDNADLYEIIRTLGEILQINYIVDPNVRGRVTIHTSGKLSRQELFPVFFQILEANGLTAVKEDSLYKIVKLKDSTQLPMSTYFGREAEDVPPGERVIIQIIPLQYISIQEMAKLLTPFVTAGGTIVSHKDSNTLLIVDKASNIQKVLRLIDVFDIDFFENVNHRFFWLRYIDAEDALKTLNDIIASYLTTPQEDIKIIPIKRINALLLISKNERVFRIAQNFIDKLDVPVEDDEPRIYVYPVKNGAAAELSGLLSSVFSKSGTDKKKKEVAKTISEDKEKPGAVKELFPTSPPPVKNVETTPGERIEGEGSGTLKGEVKITPDEVRNTLIIEATPKDYRLVENILKRIDVLPRQVLIEVTIAEITLDASNELGIEWRFDRQASGEDFIAGLQDGGTLGSTGVNFSYAILDQAKKWSATVSALAKKNKVNILSSPSVLASDNKEANINVSTEIPVASASYTYDTNTDPLLQTNIQYRNTGVILSVTPHINEFGLVSMDVNQEVSEQADQVDIGNQQTRPSFFKRSVNTSLTVKNGQTIVIGGLIRETESNGTAGLPCLGNVPVLSYVFGKKSRSLDKTELIIFITPKVIATLDDVDAVSNEFRNRISFEDIPNFQRQ